MTLQISTYKLEKLSKHAYILPGYAFKSERFTDDDTNIALVKGENLQQGFIDWADSKYWPIEEADELEKYSLKVGDVVIAMDRPWVTAGLKWAYIKKHDPKSLLVQRIARLKSKPSLDQTYLRCLISSNYFSSYIQPIVTGVNVPHISGKQIGDFKIPVPDSPIQKKIAAILSTYDDFIENNKRRITLLEKMAEELYREWFVRMRFPRYQTVKVERGVPEGWERKRLGEFCMLQRGFDLPDSQVVAGEYPVIASTSVKTYHNQYKVKPPVITTGRSGSLGKVLFTNNKAWPLNTTLFVKNFFGNSPYLIYYTLKNMGLENFNSGAGVPSLNRNHINGISLAVPPVALQKEFDNIIADIFKQSQLIEMANDSLRRSRNMLLSRLISGKLPVENLNIQFPPSMLDEREGEGAAASAKETSHAQLHLRRRHRAGNTKEAKA